ncbi:MAG: sialate O-acetylesterase, partial [Rudanella sp.]|nr:sialate O-acetylesterase [Rudanella sp.]
MKKFFTFLFLLSLVLPSLAQISMPTSRIVFQRGNDNYANVPIAGRCGSGQTIQAKVTALNGGQTVDWTTIASNATNTFEGSLRVSGGWYRLEVRSSNGGYWTVDPFGVGEVFVTAGQSNSYGNNWDTGAATDDRVSVADYWGGGGGSIAENQLPTTFSQAGLKTNAPGGNVSAGPAAPLFMWGAFADRIVQKTGVPVLILGAGYGGTSSSNWRDAANGAQSTGNVTNNAPYRGLGVAILHYLKRTGVRAVLWHQGESDGNQTSRQDYINNVMVAINKSRQQSGFSSLSWVVAKASYMPTKFTGIAAITDPNIISAQEALGGMANNWSGPYTDPYVYPQHRLDDGLHFARQDCQFLAGLWADRLDGNFFSQVQPSLPSRTPLLTTGYVLPMTVGVGAYIQVPYISTIPVGSDNHYRVDILTEGGAVLSTVANGGGNPIGVTIPAWANGRYRLRVSASSPVYQGEPSETFTVNGSGSGVPDGSTPVTPPVVTPPVTVTPPTGTFALLAPAYDCSTKQFTFNSTASAGQVHYWAAGIVGRTTSAGPYTVNPSSDANAFSLSAQLVSGGAIVNYSWDWKATCNGITPVTPPVVTTPPVIAPPTTVNPSVPTGTFSLLAPTYNCSTKQFTFNSTGADGQVRYWAAGIVGATTSGGPYTVNPASDANAFSLSAQLVSGGAI